MLESIFAMTGIIYFVLHIGIFVYALIKQHQRNKAVRALEAEIAQAKFNHPTTNSSIKLQ